MIYPLKKKKKSIFQKYIYIAFSNWTFLFPDLYLFLQAENLCTTVCPKPETAWVYRKLHIYPCVYSLLAKMLRCSVALNQMLTNLARVCKGTITRPLWGTTHWVVKTHGRGRCHRPWRGFSLGNLPSVTSQRANCQNCMFWKWLQATDEDRYDFPWL